MIENALFKQEIPEKGATKGHVHFAIKSRSPEDIALVGFCANVAASLLFERMQAQGTNIIFTLSQNDATSDVLARHENDGLNLQWTPKPADPSQLNDVQERIRNRTFFIGKKQPEIKEQKEPIQQAPTITDDEEDYLVKQLHRIP